MGEGACACHARSLALNIWLEAILRDTPPIPKEHWLSNQVKHLKPFNSVQIIIIVLVLQSMYLMSWSSRGSWQHALGGSIGIVWRPRWTNFTTPPNRAIDGSISIRIMLGIRFMQPILTEILTCNSTLSQVLVELQAPIGGQVRPRPPCGLRWR